MSCFDGRYWENGCQILSPHDTGIQTAIMANLAPYSWDTDAIQTDPSAIDVTDRLFPDYIKDVVHLGFGRSSYSKLV
jgi:phosphoglucomutase